MAVPVQITFDCHDPASLSAFWADLLGYEIQRPPPGYDSWPAFLTDQGVSDEEGDAFSADPDGAGPRLFFQRVSDRTLRVPTTASAHAMAPFVRLAVGGE